MGSHIKHKYCSNLPYIRCKFLDSGTRLPTKIYIDLFLPRLNTREGFFLKVVNLVTYANGLLQLSCEKIMQRKAPSSVLWCLMTESMLGARGLDV